MGFKVILPALFAFVLGVVVAAGVAAQTPEITPAPDVEGTPVPNATAVETAAGDFKVVFRVSLAVVSGRSQEIPRGTELVLRGSGARTCAQAPLDATALARGETMLTTEMVIPASIGCGEAGRLLAVVIVFPPDFGLEGLELSPIGWEPGVSRVIDLVIPAPVEISGGDGPQLPSTGAGGASGGRLGLTRLGWALIAIGLAAGATLWTPLGGHLIRRHRR